MKSFGAIQEWSCIPSCPLRGSELSNAAVQGRGMMKVVYCIRYIYKHYILQEPDYISHAIRLVAKHENNELTERKKGKQSVQNTCVLVILHLHITSHPPRSMNFLRTC